MCQVKDVSVLLDAKGKGRVIEVRLSTGEVAAFTFSEAPRPGGPSGLFGTRERLEPLDPSTYDERLFGSVSGRGGVS